MTMDSSFATLLLRQLFRHPACQSQRNRLALSSYIYNGYRIRHQQHQRGMSTRPGSTRGAKPREKTNEPNWQQRTQLFSPDAAQEYMAYPTVTAYELRHRKERPKRVKMLMRDFVEGELLAP
jgi:hypothetical protein